MVNKALLFGGLALLLILIIIIVIILLLHKPKHTQEPIPLVPLITPTPPPPPLTSVPLVPINPPLTPVPIVPINPPSTSVPSIPIPISTPQPTMIAVANFTPEILAHCQQQVRSITIDPNSVNFTSYNPGTGQCTFSYKPTPACPPAPKTLLDPSSAQGLAILKSREGLGWTHQTDSNWVGRPGNNPPICRPNVFYYGPTKDDNFCRLKCQLDPECKSWTYNRNNGAFPSIPVGTCWGATGAETRNTTHWGGFNSGGY